LEREREKQLRELCDKYRKNDGSYDCIVPGSGGKDSFFTSHMLQNKYGMNPLTITWAPNMYTPWGLKNMENWVNSGVDNTLLSPNRRVQRLLTRLSLEHLLHPFQAFQFGQKYLAPRIAMRHNVELIFYGEHMAEYGNSLEEVKTPIMDEKYFINDDENLYVGGVSHSDLISKFGLSNADLKHYKPLTTEEIGDSKIQVHYFGFYEPWHPQGTYYYAVEHGGFVTSPERLSGSYSKYNSIDDKMEEFNYYTLGIKYGLGWTSNLASLDTRNGDLTRDEAVALTKKYDIEYPETWINDFLNYVSIPAKEFPIASKQFEQPIMDREYFDNLVDSFRSPHIWKLENDIWTKRKNCWNENKDGQNTLDSASIWTGNK
jgi:N-acetyl sugar amidotransferase